MSAGFTFTLGKRMIVGAPKLPEGCSSCERALECAAPARAAFNEIRNLPDVSIVDRNKATFDSSLVEDETYRNALTDFDIASTALSSLLDSCNSGAMDIYVDGEYQGQQCGA